MIESVRKMFVVFKPVWTILAVVSLSLTLLLGLMLISLQKEQSAQSQEIREDFTWNITQVEREGLVFLDSVHRYRDAPQQENFENVTLLFDIFWSRIYSLEEGEFGRFILEVKGTKESLDILKKSLKKLDPVVARIAEHPQQHCVTIIDETSRSLKLIHVLANRMSEHMMNKNESKRNRFSKLYTNALILLACTTVVSVVLIILILRQQFKLDHLTRKLEQRVEVQSADLRTSRQKVLLLSQAVEQSPASVVICSENGEIEYVNAQFEKISGYSADEIIGKKPNILKSHKTPHELYEEMWKELKEGREWRGELCNRKKNGELFWEQISISPIIDEETRVTRFLSIQEDITQRKQYEERLLHMANYDDLTQLPNRGLANDRLGQAIRSAGRTGDLVGLLFIDLDNFKQVNDTLGHEGGDELLKNVALRLASCLRSCDTAARFGGDEFVVILSELTTRDDAIHITKRIIGAFSKPFTIQKSKVLTTTSIGISFSPDDGIDPAELLNNADSAMYLAKAEGKSGYRIFGE